MKKAFYVGVAGLVYAVLAIAAVGWFRWKSPPFALLGVLSAVGIVPFTLAAVRSLRGIPVDDRLITTWAWLSAGTTALLRFSEKRGMVELVLGILLLGTGILSLIGFLRSPKPALSGSDAKPTPSPPPDLPGTGQPPKSTGVALGLGFFLLVAAPVSQCFLRPRSLFLVVALVAISLTLVLGDALLGRRRGP